MFINGVQCDTCCKIHNKNVHSCPWPKEWVSLQQDQQELHFCSTHCLHEWVEKQTIASNKFDVEGPIEGVVMSVEKHQGRLLAKRKENIEHDVHPDPSAMTKAETILQWIERARSEAKLGSPVTRLSVLVDDIEELCRNEGQMIVAENAEIDPSRLELWKEVKVVRAEMIEKDEYWRDL